MKRSIPPTANMLQVGQKQMNKRKTKKQKKKHVKGMSKRKRNCSKRKLQEKEMSSGNATSRTKAKELWKKRIKS